MANITMIPIGELEHHPENVRKDLGDLTELTESIRKNGVLHELTAEEWLAISAELPNVLELFRIKEARA